MAQTTEHVEDGLAEGLDVVSELTKLVEVATSPEDYIRRLPRILADHFRSPLAGITYGLGSFTVQESVSDEFDSCLSWEGPLAGAILESEREGRAFARVYDGPEDTTITLCALPTRIPGLGSGGAIGVLVFLPAKESASSVLSELRALVSLFELGAPRASTQSDGEVAGSSDSISKSVEGMSKAAGYRSLFEFAFAITNNLRTKVDCDQVVLSQVTRNRVKILSISGIDDPNPRTPGVMEIIQAQEECADQSTEIFCQEVPDWDDGITSSYRLHSQWRETSGGANVGSIPLLVDDQVVAVISLRRPPTKAFTRDEIDACVKRVTPFARSIEMLRLGDRGVTQHAAESLRRQFDELFGQGRYARKIVAATVLGAFLWFLFGHMTVRRPMVGRVSAGEVVHLAAPFGGAISQVYVEEGAAVTAGQELARLDTQDLELERADLEAQRASVRIEIDQYIAASDLTQADFARARGAVIDAQLEGVSRRIESAVIRAPKDGVILRGDVKERTLEVVPQGEPLFEFVADGDLRLELEVPEAYVDELAQGSEVNFAANAAPEKDRKLVVRDVHAASEVRAGQNVFVSTAEFRLEDDGEPVDLTWMRVGMEGVAKVNVGKRPIREVAFERIAQAIYQSVWL